VQGLSRFPETWTVEDHEDRFQVYDATGRFLMAVGHRQDLHKAGWTQSDNYLTAEERGFWPTGLRGCQGLWEAAVLSYKALGGDHVRRAAIPLGIT
jgi:hypothetical protein